MKCYLFSDTVLPFTREQLESRMAAVTGGTETGDLVTAIYITSGIRASRGTAYVQRWKTPRTFHASRGYWAFTRAFGTPEDLPHRYKLIKVHVHPGRSYPGDEIDIYGWRFRYDSLLDHVLFLFAHELHHYRRYHLSLHPREGEHAANRWALQKCLEAGLPVSGRRLPVKKKKRATRKPALPAQYLRFRTLQAGDRVRISTDSRGIYRGQTAAAVRPIRPNSKRMVIRTGDGKTWRWPLTWLDPL
ncbi:hypothetical protein JXO52_00525 [bacterium]|nr:hypothetical protein [bacterium]